MITLKTLSQATTQEVFDQVVNHLLSQGIQSKDEDESICMYRGKGGLMCAAGCLIGQEEYSEKFEGVGWTQLVQSGMVPKDHKDLIRKLQSIHDNNYSSKTPEWENRLKLLADELNLEFNYKG